MTTRTIPSFEYIAPRTLREAITASKELGDSARILAGGTDLLVQMKKREVTPRYIIDISHVPGFSSVKLDGRKGLVIGALTKVCRLEDPLIRKAYPAMYEAVESFASVGVREMATVGGNLCNASPAADLAPPLLIGEAKLKVAGPAGKRIIAIEDFFKGPGRTALRRGEILVEAELDRTEAGAGSAFVKLARSMQDLAKVSVAVLVCLKKDAIVKSRIALGAVAPFPMRSRKAEKMLEGKKVDDVIMEEVGEIAASEIRPITDVRSTKEYRRRVSGRLVQKAIIAAIERARGRKTL